MAAMMLICSNRKIMGKFMVGPIMRIVGWMATAIMSAAVIGMGVAAFG